MLSSLLIIPLAGALLISLWPTKLESSQARLGALITLGVTLVGALYLVSQFDLNNPGLQFVEKLNWVEALGLTYVLGVDGIALPLVVINCLLSLVSVYLSANINRPRLYFALLLLISGAVTGAFLAQNLLLFFLFYELELLPLYLLIAIWGGRVEAMRPLSF